MKNLLKSSEKNSLLAFNKFLSGFDFLKFKEDSLVISLKDMDLENLKN